MDNKKFTNAFDPLNKEHVLWLKMVGNTMKVKEGDKKLNMEKMINESPLGVKIDNMMDWAFVHFQLAMLYTNAVLNGNAYIPPK